ncbi:threonine synthase [Spirilliplanes yamanashiensis]|uniref:Threonine synthase n=1 Tax=Spirilliplanes yamanashiensis TaxID=42233 RepID=A0A8J4DHE9_9ACTN|nr:pyridoxal-phosphate dependent enzyme [Spirilliplanes yamanashiensis]MDP9819893.1 threonine synthase [Spirilliplanes yamanashiensis]GIJ01288.1 threonine synthase [Spirilliplanes yamanashiensis]
MSAYTGRLRCVRCGGEHPDPSLELVGAGCPACAADGVPANILPGYDLTGLTALPVDAAQPGLFRYRALLPLAAGTAPVSLGEGGTPVVELPQLAERTGVARVWVKDESRNPTWSYKDRLAAVAVTKAVEVGAETVVVASTGNHGAAVAAYAARAGLRCVVLTLASVPATMKTLMQSYGADVVALERPPDRWSLMRDLVAARGWMAMSGFAYPPAGSNPYGVDGYKTIAYELVEQLPRPPDVVVVPVAYGDGLAGIARGFADLAALGVIERAPRLLAAEPFGPLAEALATGAATAGPVPVRPSVSFSTASPFGTQQSLAALRAAGGAAVATPDDEEIMATQLQLARESGVYLEASSVTAVVALAAARAAGTVRPDDTVVVVGTSTGLKDVGATAARLPEVPLIVPTIGALDDALAGAPAARPAG